MNDCIEQESEDKISNMDKEKKPKQRQKSKQKPKRKSKSSTNALMKKQNDEEMMEYNYDYNVVTDENGEMYIDITIDVDSFNGQNNPSTPQLTFYNLHNMVIDSINNEMEPVSSIDSYASYASCKSHESNHSTSPNSIYSTDTANSYYSSSSHIGSPCQHHYHHQKWHHLPLHYLHHQYHLRLFRFSHSDSKSGITKMILH